ncbi:hypothetical protein Pelo_5988 [Pelomyxa schiedti]|nr:hypothetical protein Pelo_5988 [Pelomyxa schiedti]
MFATSVATGTREWFCEDARLSIEKWPEGLLALSAPSRAVPMSRGTIAAVLRNSDLYCGDEDEDEDAEGEASDDRANEELVRTLTEQIDDHVRAFGGAAFVKIGRSPKDVVYCEASEALERRLYEELTKIAESMDGTETPAEISNLEVTGLFPGQWIFHFSRYSPHFLAYCIHSKCEFVSPNPFRKGGRSTSIQSVCTSESRSTTNTGVEC